MTLETPQTTTTPDGGALVGKPLSVGDTVMIRGDLRMNYVGNGKWQCAYLPEQLIDGKYVRHANYDRPWTGVVDAIQGDMVHLAGGKGWWNVRLLEASNASVTSPAPDGRPWFRDVKVGDMLHPDPLWNRTERGPNRLADPTSVLGITEATSQSGVLFEVRTKDGFTRHLDAGWFKRPDSGSAFITQEEGR